MHRLMHCLKCNHVPRPRGARVRAWLNLPTFPKNLTFQILLLTRG